MRHGRVKVHLLSTDWVQPGYKAIAGYKGFGAVGIITVLHVIESLEMERIGIITAKYHPEYVFRDNRGLSYPFEIYADRKNKIIALATREIPDDRIRAEFVWELTKFLKQNSIEKLYMIGGLDSRYKKKPDDQLRWIANKHYEGPFPKDPQFEKGLLIVGPLALQMMFSEIIGIPALTLLPFSKADTPDPAAAAVAIERLNQLLDLNIPTEELLREAARIQEELSKLEEMIARETQQKGPREPYM